LVALSGAMMDFSTTMSRSFMSPERVQDGAEARA
jgi:hypothetical protein